MLSIQTINFDAIYNEQVNFINSQFPNVDKSLSSEVCTLIENRTIYLPGLRQSGRTYWISNKVAKDDKAIFIVYNEGFRELNLNNFPFLSKDKIITVIEVMETDLLKNISTPIDKIFIDSSGYIFEKFNRRKFYKQLLTIPTLIDNPLIICSM